MLERRTRLAGACPGTQSGQVAPRLINPQAVSPDHQSLVFTLNLLLSTLSWLQPLVLRLDTRNSAFRAEVMVLRDGLWRQPWPRPMVTIERALLGFGPSSRNDATSSLKYLIKGKFRETCPETAFLTVTLRNLVYSSLRHCAARHGQPIPPLAGSLSVLIRALAYVVFIWKHRQCPTRWFMWCLHTHTSTGSSPSRSCNQMRAVSLCSIQHLQKSH